MSIAGLVLLLGLYAFKAYGPNQAMAEGSPGPSNSFHTGESEGEVSQRDMYWALRRGLQFGVPQAGYRTAAAQMTRMEAAAALNVRSRSLTSPAPPPLAWHFIGPLPMFDGLPKYRTKISGAPRANSPGRATALA